MFLKNWMQNNSSCGVDFEKFLNAEVPLTLKDEWVRIVHNLLYSHMSQLHLPPITYLMYTTLFEFS